MAPPEGGVLLDFGCGTGAQTLFFAPHFPKTLATDVEQNSLDELTRSALAAGLADRIVALHYDGRDLPIESATVDYAISFEVLEHVDDEVCALSELRRVLKPGAVLAMSVPNRWWIFETHGAALPLLKWNRVPFFSWLPKPLHDRWARARIYSRREITAKLRTAGFTVQDAVYITAPMDVIRNRAIKRLLRASVFKSDRTSIPFLATAVLMICRRV